MLLQEVQPVGSDIVLFVLGLLAIIIIGSLIGAFFNRDR